MSLANLNDTSFEISLLASMMYSPDLISELSEETILHPDDFIESMHYEISRL